MNLRRTTLKGIISAFSSVIFLQNRSFACVGDFSKPIIDVFINKKHFKKFQYENIESFLHSEYRNLWSWSNAIKGSEGYESHMGEYQAHANHEVVPIEINYNKNDSEPEMYCSKIDIIYTDVDTDALYVTASVHLAKNTVPYLATRIKMSSVKSKVYVALTFRNITTNEITGIKVSSKPFKLRAYSCSPLNFIYIDA